MCVCRRITQMNWLTAVLELTVELLPAPASLVDAKGEHSIGRPHASTDHGALSYILLNE